MTAAAARLQRPGPIGWMARHGVAPNLLMLLMLLGGLLFANRITQEIFPAYETDTVVVSVALPGATPEEVESAVTLAIEDELGGIEGIEKITATAREGATSVIAEIAPERDRRVVYSEIEQAVDRITTFPEDAEKPEVRLVVAKRRVMELQLHGDVDPHALRMAAEELRRALLLEDGISQVEFAGTRELEIHVEMRQGALLAHGLTLEEVAARLRQSAVERGGGSIETRGEDLLLRLDDRRDTPEDFAATVLIADAGGPLLRLGDIAAVRRGFADTGTHASFDGLPSVELGIFRTGAETPITVSEAVRAALPGAMATLPEAFRVAITDDDAEIYRGRLELLLKNGFIGLILVLLVLSLFLEYRLAFWVAVGIPTAFLGTFLFLPGTGASLNMVTMFAFILALGIVVDDAIVVGENIYEYMERGMGRLEAAIQGARDIATPLAFSILTNIAAFLPLALIPGAFGKFFVWIPIVVASAFLLSWIEALFVLPAHLAGVTPRGAEHRPWRIERIQRRVSAGLAWGVRRIYGPLLRLALSWRYATAALMIAAALVVLAWPASGRLGFSLFPSIPRDYAQLTVTLPISAPDRLALAVRDRMVAAARRVVAENGGPALGRGVHALVEMPKITVRAYLVPGEARPITTAAFTEKWRAALGPIPEARSRRFSASFGGPGGAAGVAVQLSHVDEAALAAAARDLAARLGDFAAVRDVEDGFTPGKTQIAFRITEAGRTLGLTAEEVGRQVRAAFLGVEALAQQDGRNEVTVRVRLVAEERRAEADLAALLIRTPDGGTAPLPQVAALERSRSAAEIAREDGRRIVTVTGEIEPEEMANRIETALRETVLPALKADHPGLGWRFGGRQETQQKTMDSFTTFSIPLTLALIYALLAVPFRSYVQPVIVMAAIPFGVVGAVLGHMLMGMALSMVSLFGVIALSGVVINAAIVMIDHANRARLAGLPAFDAIWQAGQRRFRPILLTTLTTFGGLAPMIFETSRQAKFLIPMAVSLGYGILFATVIVLFLIPALYLIVEDLRWLANPPKPGRSGEARDPREPAPVRPAPPLPGR
ncbi:efflux RND transporter permease subunit [Paralimibaculum aggregatum]|uniref:Efflux RND transporter permease subunit n=1 Tax=Paralimibaculum aggregatum TaxID=3036245 RepID=A0ABQ6LQS7_9RHOB|nr:efflux RND transporter permease subunit [Limibaculum sp. NKW23]GMG83384.1 efflux RND transporter permease subunit [Limibaculum sp. NKW23]